MDINQLLSQAELNLIIDALQVYKLEQETEEHTRKRQGWNTDKQSECIQILDDIEEKLFEYIQ